MLKKIKTTSKTSGTPHIEHVSGTNTYTASNAHEVLKEARVCTKLEHCDIEFNNENEKKLVEYINKIVDKINQC